MSRPTVMQGNPNSRVAMPDVRVCRAEAASRAVPNGFFSQFVLGFDAPLLDQVQDGRQQAEAKRRIGQQQGDDVRHQPADPDPLRGKR